MKNKWIRLVTVMAATLIIMLAGRGISLIFSPEPAEKGALLRGVLATARHSPTPVAGPDWVVKDYLVPNPYSRPQTPLSQVNGIVVHYVGNPGTTAEGNKSYFEQLAQTGETYASSHFIIGLDGEIIQCIPLNEISYCSNERNDDTIAIECCHPDEGGQFTEATYNSLLRLTSWLCQAFSLDPSSDVIRHYDVTGKECPLYYVKNPQAWQQFLSDLSAFDPET